jgi:hypothetical protein
MVARQQDLQGIDRVPVGGFRADDSVHGRDLVRVDVPSLFLSLLVHVHIIQDLG